MLRASNSWSHRVFGIGISIPIFLFSTVLIFIFYIMSSKESASIPVPVSPPRSFHFNYTVLKGYFLQSEDSTDDTKFDFKKQNFGLIDRSYPSDSPSSSKQLWPRFESHIHSLSTNLKENESLKVLFLGRHGQGWHNVAESKYGTHAWDCYYSLLDGYDGLVWADAELTPLGEQQARDVNALWKQKLGEGIPRPERWYVSPLTRTLQTADLSFEGLEFGERAYVPFVKELLREALGVHTCDRRSTLTQIKAEFPHATYEKGFKEEDTLWEKDYREPRSARKYRLATFLDDVFASDEGTFLSFTSHSGAIASILEAVGHREFKLETGGVIPVVVKAERVQGKREVPPKEPSEAPPVCEPPELQGNHATV